MRAAWRHLDAKGFEGLGQILSLDLGLGRLALLGRCRLFDLGLHQGRLGLALEFQQALHLRIGTSALGTKFQQRCGAKHLGGPARILLTGKLQHQLVVAHGLQGGFGNPQAIDAPIQHILHGFKLLLLNRLDRPTGQHLKGELAATLKIQPQGRRGIQHQRG